MSRDFEPTIEERDDVLQRFAPALTQHPADPARATQLVRTLDTTLHWLTAFVKSGETRDLDKADTAAHCMNRGWSERLRWAVHNYKTARFAHANDETCHALLAEAAALTRPWLGFLQSLDVQFMTVDGDTGLPEKRQFEKELRALLDAGKPCTVVLASVEGIHHLSYLGAGEEARGLNAVVQTLSSHFPQAPVYRLTPEVFAVRLSNVRPGDAQGVCSSVLEALRELLGRYDATAIQQGIRRLTAHLRHCMHCMQEDFEGAKDFEIPDQPPFFYPNCACVSWDPNGSGTAEQFVERVKQCGRHG